VLTLNQGFETAMRGTHPAPLECCHRSEERNPHGTHIVGGVRKHHEERACQPSSGVVPVVTSTTQKRVSKPIAARKTGAKRKVAAVAHRKEPSTTDAIAYLKADHRAVERLFRAYEKAGDRALRTKRKLVDDMVRELVQHSAIEEQVFYPAARREVPSSTDDVLESLEEHHIVKWLLSELVGMDPADERFNAKVTVLVENVRHHIRDEEHDLFPVVRAHVGRKALVELGDQLRKAKRLAPTRPHPRSPDEPPGNIIVGAVAGVVDRARSAVNPKA
jgi:hemerythrin-like domain-containing protein